MPKRSDFVEIHNQMQLVRFIFSDDRAATFAGPPLPLDHKNVVSIEFSPILNLPDDMRLGVKSDGVITFIKASTLEGG